MGSEKSKDKAAAKARAKERRAEERAQVTPTAEWSAAFREELGRLFAAVKLDLEAANADALLAELERGLFRERMKPAVAAQEAYRSVQTLIKQREAGLPDPESITFSIREEAGTKYVTFTQFRVRITPGAGQKLDYQLDGLDGCDPGAFDDILRLAREARDGEYYLHGAAASEWWATTRGTRPTFDQLANMARHLYKNQKFSVKFYK